MVKQVLPSSLKALPWGFFYFGFLASYLRKPACLLGLNNVLMLAGRLAQKRATDRKVVPKLCVDDKQGRVLQESVEHLSGVFLR
ncbi:hypothetical protein HNQ50_002537 [Silvimonas terrae]|uniref:Uncharacterized protein n=1 Tax=Silvimonas terrae TaxID=300266 RepID=A0A840RFJ8_9NEIS|nr:hypothetical protein [Silvimonas terrae]